MIINNSYIYLDYAATTPVDKRVVEEMNFCWNYAFGNSGAIHKLGRLSKQKEDYARENVAKLINAHKDEIIFTSGATEANNLAIRGGLEFYTDKNHWISINTLHKSIREIDRRADSNNITVLKVNSKGLIDLEDFKKNIRDDTLLIATSIICSETGIMENIKDISNICKEKGIFLHCDLAQGFGKVEIDVEELGIDSASISGHKIYGPKGIGALYIRRKKGKKFKIRPLVYGGGQENGLRSGTNPTPLIIGLGKAAEIALIEQAKNLNHIKNLYTFFIRELKKNIEKVYINGNEDRQYPGIINVSFAGIEGESLMQELEHIMLSSGSACTSDSLESSYVLYGLGVGDDLAHTSLRFSIGKDTTLIEIKQVINDLTKAVKYLRSISPVWDMIEANIDLNKVKWS